MIFHTIQLKNHSIRTQLMIGFLVVLIPLVLVLEITFYFYSADIMLQKILEQASETIEQFSNSLDHFMEQNINKVEMIAYTPTIQKVLNDKRGKIEPTQEGEDVFFSTERQIQRIMLKEFSSVTMNDIELYGLNGINYYFSVWSEKREIPGEEELFRKADEAKGKWSLILQEQTDDTLQLIKQVRDLQTYKPIGYIRIGLKRSYLDKLAAAVNFDSQGKVIILRSQEVIVGENIREELIMCMLRETSPYGHLRYEEEGKAYRVVYVYSGTMNWKNIGLISESYINKELTDLKYTTLFLIILSVVIGILIVSRIAQNLVSPIKETADALELFSQGDFEVRLPEGRQDEIGKMNEVFNKAIEDIKRLMQRVTQAEILQKEMEFKTLQSQMNPHFIYNTLDAVNWMAFKKGETEICGLITAISNLLRASISNKQSIVSIKQELSYVGDYLHIQQIKYHDQFQVFYDVDETILDQPIPKLVIQPMVENAVVHGIEGGQSGTSVLLRIQKIDDNIHIMVKDDGVGMPDSKVKSLFYEQYTEPDSQNTSHTHLGIYAVHKRLQFLYGEKYGVQVLSSEGEGTTISLHIPYMKKPKKLYKTYNMLVGGKDEY